jgi:hypothetical protein
MKQPLYALLIAPDVAMRHQIVTGWKKITIREGHRDYRPGPVMLCCHEVPWAVMADITEVTHKTLIDVTPDEYVADGFDTADHLLAGMRQFYPKMDWTSPVTVIRFENARGALVRRYIDGTEELGE